MLTIGVVGGVASGKSQVARCFEELGCLRLDGDVIGHEVLQDDEVQSILRKRFGMGVIDFDGKIDRRAVAKLVFADTVDGHEQLKFLESVTHPRIAERISVRLREAEQRNMAGAVVDAAVMMKAGWDHLCNHVIFVDVPRAVRLARALQRGWTEQHFDARERSQLPLHIKQQRSNSIIDNSGTLEETLGQVHDLWEVLSAEV